MRNRTVNRQERTRPFSAGTLLFWLLWAVVAALFRMDRFRGTMRHGSFWGSDRISA